jgi:hypothetical protein
MPEGRQYNADSHSTNGSPSKSLLFSSSSNLIATIGFTDGYGMVVFTKTPERTPRPIRVPWKDPRIQTSLPFFYPTHASKIDGQVRNRLLELALSAAEGARNLSVSINPQKLRERFACTD